MDWGFWSTLHHILGGKAAPATAGTTEILFDAVNSGCAVWFWLVSFYFCASQHSLRISEILTQHQKRHKNCSWPEIHQPFIAAKLFFKRLPEKEKAKQPTTNRKVAALLKFLCLSNQSGDWECCGAPCRHSQPWACYLLWAPLGEKTSSGIQVKRGKELAHVSPREVTDSWQHPLDPEAASVPERWWRREVGWKEGETIFGLRDPAPFRILGQMKNSSWSEKNPLNIQKYTARGRALSSSAERRRSRLHSAISSAPVSSGLVLQTLVMPRKEELEVAWTLKVCFCFYIDIVVHVHERDK